MNRKIVFAAVAALSVFSSGLAIAEMEGDFPQRDASPAVATQAYPAPQARIYPGALTAQQLAALPPCGEGPVTYAYRGRGVREPQCRERAIGANRQYHVGDRLPYEYRDQAHFVGDWQRRNLSAPRRNEYWVQTGDNYVLVSSRTGAILRILFDN